MRIDFESRNFKIIARFLFGIYLLLLVKVILFKYPMAMLIESVKLTDMEVLRQRVLYANFVPFKTILFYLSADINPGISRINLSANLIAFMPLGFMLPFLKAKFSSYGKILSVALGTSLFFEILQLVTGIGSFDVDDLILNVAGALVGFLLYQPLRKVHKQRQFKFR